MQKKVAKKKKNSQKTAQSTLKTKLKRRFGKRMPKMSAGTITAIAGALIAGTAAYLARDVIRKKVSGMTNRMRSGSSDLKAA